jgi:hypothetical protein
MPETARGIPGDPLNVGLIGTEKELIQAILGSGWDSADPVSLESSIRIAGSVLRDRREHPWIETVAVIGTTGTTRKDTQRNPNASMDSTSQARNEGVLPRETQSADRGSRNDRN